MMKKENIRWILLACIGLIGLICLYTEINQLIIRQPFRLFGKVFIFAVCLYFAFSGIRKIPSEKKFIVFLAYVFTAIISLVFVFFLFLSERDKETIVQIDGEKKIRKESSFVMFYEVAYYDYDNFFCYRAYPRIVENYDDGDLEQYVYTDYYDEKGVLIVRKYADEE